MERTCAERGRAKRKQKSVKQEESNEMKQMKMDGS